MNQRACRRHCWLDGYSYCVLCGMPEHGFCQQDYHRCRDNGWAFDGWWR